MSDNLFKGSSYSNNAVGEMKLLIDMLVPLVSSYRLLVGAADEFNRISLVNKHDIEEAIDRADDLGDIIDDIQDELHKALRQYIGGADCKKKSREE